MKSGIQWSYFTPLQRNFLHAIRDTGDSVSKITTKLNLKVRQVGKWLDNPRFKQALDQFLRQINNVVQLDMKRAAQLAAGVLLEQVVQPEPEDARWKQAFQIMEYDRKKSALEMRYAVQLNPNRPELIDPKMPSKELKELLKVFDRSSKGQTTGMAPPVPGGDRRMAVPILPAGPISA